MNGLLILLAQRRGNPDDIDPAILVAVSLFYCVIIAVMMVPHLAGMWKVFEKAGEPGWAALIPLYNFMVLLRISGMSEMWVLGLFVPCLSLYPLLASHIKLAEKFGKDAGFGVAMAFLPFIFFPILGFGEARFRRGYTWNNRDDDYGDEE